VNDFVGLNLLPPSRLKHKAYGLCRSLSRLSDTPRLFVDAILPNCRRTL
jgi:hypothetical protein